MYWEAYQDLQSERRTPRGMIPVSAIVAYCQAYGLNPDTVKRIVWKVDQVLLNHWKEKDEADRLKREAEAQRNKQPGARS